MNKREDFYDGSYVKVRVNAETGQGEIVNYSIPPTIDN